MTDVSSLSNPAKMLIVGQGLAGSILANKLISAGIDVLVIDQGHEESSSDVAAGIINPITGRFFVKSWMIDELIPTARDCYKALEKELKISIWSDRTVYRALSDSRAVNEWQSRSTRPGWGQYMTGLIDTIGGLDQFSNVNQWGVTAEAAQVDLRRLLKSYRKQLKDRKILLVEKFDHDQVVFDDDMLKYQGKEFDGIIFAEGSGVRQNKFFQSLPFQPVKGEVLHIEMPDLPSESIIKNQLLFAPIQDGEYWVGANYDHQFTDHHPTEQGFNWLKDKLQEVLNVSYVIKDHRAGIRPSVKDRRPILGNHPKFSKLYIFNGFGTKGTSLIPYFTNRFTDWLINGKPLPEEVNIERFYRSDPLI